MCHLKAQCHSVTVVSRNSGVELSAFECSMTVLNMRRTLVTVCVSSSKMYVILYYDRTVVSTTHQLTAYKTYLVSWLTFDLLLCNVNQL